MSRALTTEETAARLRVTPRTIYDYLKAGKIQGRKVGKKWLFLEENVERLLHGDPADQPPAQAKG